MRVSNIRLLLALTSLAVACSEVGAPPETPNTPSTLAIAESTLATTEEGFLLPPGVEALTTTTPPSVRVFDDRSVCDPAAEDLDVLRMQTLVAAYNNRNREQLAEVMQTGVFDWTALPHLGVNYTDDPLAWAEAGWAVADELELVLVRTYSGIGADGLLRRRNDLLDEAGIGWLTYSFKVQARGCAITRFVGYFPTDDRCRWISAFRDELTTAEDFIMPEECQ
jgi:hypothetical protein